MQRLFSLMFALAIAVPTLGLAVHARNTRPTFVSLAMPVPMCEPDYKGVCPIGGPKLSDQLIVSTR